jgi:hypothetical protein
LRYRGRKTFPSRISCLRYNIRVNASRPPILRVSSRLYLSYRSERVLIFAAAISTQYAWALVPAKMQSNLAAGRSAICNYGQGPRKLFCPSDRCVFVISVWLNANIVLMIAEMTTSLGQQLWSRVAERARRSLSNSGLFLSDTN